MALESWLVEVLEAPCVVGNIEDVDTVIVILVELVDVVPQLFLVPVWEGRYLAIWSILPAISSFDLLLTYF